MNAQATLPDPDQLWTLEEQVIAVQQLAFRFFEQENWVWAAKMLMRVERMARRLEPAKNPLTRDGERFLRRAKRRASTQAPQPEAEPEPPPTDEEEYAVLVDVVEEANDRRTRAKVPLMTMEEAFAYVARQRGRELADRLAAIHARQTPGPSG